MPHPGDLTPVFDAMLEKARGLCERPHRGSLDSFSTGERFRAVATRFPPACPEALCPAVAAGLRGL